VNWLQITVNPIDACKKLGKNVFVDGVYIIYSFPYPIVNLCRAKGIKI